MGPFAGRADNMVKLRGVNVWPEAIGEIALDDPRLQGEYFVRALRGAREDETAERDEMIVHVATAADPKRYEDIRTRAEQRLKERLGVRIGVEVREVHRMAAQRCNSCLDVIGDVHGVCRLG